MNICKEIRDKRAARIAFFVVAGAAALGLVLFVFDAINEAKLARAAHKLTGGRPDDTLRQYKKIIALNDAPEAWSGAGRCFSALGQHDSALVYIDRAVGKGYNDRAAYEARARSLYAAGGRYQKLRALGQLLRLTPDDSQLRRKRAELNLEISELIRAQHDLRRAMAASPRDYDLLCLLARVKNRMVEHDSAEYYADKAVKLAPERGRAYTERGISRYYRRDIEAAFADYAEARRRDSLFPGAYVTAAKHLAEQDRHGDIIALAKQAPDTAAAYAEFWGRIGYAKYRTADMKGAIEAYTRAITLNPAEPRYYQLRGDCYRYIDDTTAAKRDSAKHQELLDARQRNR